MIHNLEKYKDILLACSYYAFFLFLCAFTKSTTVFVGIFKYLPDFGLLFIYYIFFILNFSHFFYIHLILFGIITDTFTFLPLGVTSLTLLITYKLYFLAKSITLNIENNFVYIFRDLVIFYFLFFIIEWFAISVSNKDFVPILEILKLMIKNIFYSTVFFTIKNNKVINND